MPTAAPPSPAAAPRPSGRVLALVGAALVAAGGVAVLAGRLGGTPDPPRMSALPDFRLTERSGRPLSLADLRGRPWVADFIFTRCGGACPAMTARMARLRARPLVGRARSCPSPSTPPTTRRRCWPAMPRPSGADESWHFADWSPRRTSTTCPWAGFKLAAMEVPAGEQAAGGDGPFLHSSKFVLVDGEGVIRGYYDSTDEKAMRALVARRRRPPGRTMTVTDLPALNACLNATSARAPGHGVRPHPPGPPHRPQARHAGRAGLLRPVPDELPRVPRPGGIGPLPRPGGRADGLLHDPPDPHGAGGRDRAPGRDDAGARAARAIRQATAAWRGSRCPSGPTCPSRAW